MKMRALIATLLLGAGACASFPRGAPESTIYLVRHAERAAAPADDPVLTAAGTARANALATELGDAGITTILVTPRQRTGLTAAPLARARGLTPRVVSFYANTAAHIDSVAAVVRALPPGTRALVVGHSNTVPAIVHALGGPPFRDLCDAQYATLFIVHMRGAQFVKAETRPYGAPDPADAASCAAAPVMR